MKVEKVDIKELGFTEQLLYGNDIKDNRIKELEEENKNLKSEIENMKEVGRENIETLDRMSIELENYSKSFKRYRDFSKQELADSLYDSEEQNKKLKEINESQNEEIQRFKDNAMQDMREITELEIENKKLKSDLGTVIDERDNAFKKIKQLEERLDNKEKVNKQLREELGKFIMNNPS